MSTIAIVLLLILVAPNTIALTTTIKRSFSGLFYTEIFIGTPPMNLSLVVDTGSSPTWVQSAFCIECFNVSSANFDPSRSSSFQPMHPNHPLCVRPYLMPTGDQCTYDFSYGIGEDNTTGLFGLDTFTFGADGPNQQPVAVPGVAFGQGLVNRIPHFPGDARHPNPLSGIFGLGRDKPISFLLQFQQITMGKFSYCLPYSEGDVAELRFGKEAELSGAGIQSTPILGDPHAHYKLNLTGVTFNGLDLPIDPKLISGCIMDSGVDVSLFVPKAYKIIRNAMVSYFLETHFVQPLNKTQSGFKLCYDLADVLKAEKVRGDRVCSVAPTMSFKFDGAELQLDEATTFKKFDEMNEFCFMIEPNYKPLKFNVFGAFQQFNRRFLYDVAASKLSFVTEKC